MFFVKLDLLWGEFMKHLFVLKLAVCLLTGMFAVTSASAQTLVNANFENMTLGAVPSSSAVPSAGVAVTNPTTAAATIPNTITVANTDDQYWIPVTTPANQYLDLANNATGGVTARFQANSASAVTSGFVNYTFDFVTSNLNNVNFFMGVINNSGTYISDIILNGTSLEVFQYGLATTGIFITSSGVAANTEYQVSEAFNFSTQMVTVTTTNVSAGTLLGSVVTGTFGSTTPSANNIDGVAFLSGSSATVTNWEIDNLLLQVPEPASAALAALGLGAGFLLLRRRRNRKP